MPALRKAILFSVSVLLLQVALPSGIWAANDPVSSSETCWSVVRKDGVYWLQTPEGALFYSKGVNTANGGMENEKSRRRESFFWVNHFADISSWRHNALERLTGWGFNTRGGWSDSSQELSLPLMVELDLGRHAKLHWFDPFDPANEGKTLQLAKKLTAKYRDDPNLIGYFTDNEVGWWNAPLFRWYLEQGWENHTKRVLWQLLNDHYSGDWNRFLEDWVPQNEANSFEDLKRAGVALKMRIGGDGIHLIDRFTYLCARRYYELVYKALRQAHPGALVLGDRLPLYYNQNAVLAMADHVDVISTNYNVDVPDGWVAPYYFEGLRELADKPVLVTEFFFAAHENRSGNLNPGHLMTVATQEERARGVANAIRSFASFPNVVGAHWFQYADEPKGGREDGENYNMGLIDHANLPYEEVTEVFSAVNPELEDVHRSSAPLHIALASDGEGLVQLQQKRQAMSIADNSLLDWDKAPTRLEGFRSAKPYVPFADVHLTWAPEGLYLASIASNYVDWGLLDYKGSFPLSETFQLHLLVKDKYGKLHHYAVHLFPEQSRRFRDRLEIQPQLYRYAGGAAAEKLPIGGHLQKLNKPLPHIAFEAFFPAEWMGFAGFQGGDRLEMSIYLTSYYRERTMTWSASGSLQQGELPGRLRTVVLEGLDQRASGKDGNRSLSRLD
ncbi:MAG: hypothetical protein RBS57_04110 [Desulforhabdus sp.]|jgi:hypothetical protein|nr:hypothetical protein [Desulforhabdus sp.]